MTGNFPARKFEESAEITGISRNYVIPDDMTMSKFDIFVHENQDDAAEISILTKKILALNPQLKEIPNIEENKYHLLRGVGSGFNISDISFFLNDYPTIQSESLGSQLESSHQTFLKTFDGNSMEARHYKIYVTALSQKLGCSIDWTPSLETIELIKEKCSLSDWVPSQKEWKSAQSHNRQNLHAPAPPKEPHRDYLIFTFDD